MLGGLNQKGLNQLATKPYTATCSLCPGWKWERVRRVKVRKLVGDSQAKPHMKAKKSKKFISTSRGQAGLSHPQDSLAPLGIALTWEDKLLSLQMLSPSSFFPQLYKGLDSVLELLSNNENIPVISTLLSAQSKTAL